MDSNNNDFEFIANDKCNFDQDIDSSDNAQLDDEYDLKKQFHEISELKKYLTQQTSEYSTLIQTLQKERDEYKKLNTNLQAELIQISQLKATLKNDHIKFNKMLESFNSITQSKKEDTSDKNENNINNEPFFETEEKSVVTKHCSHNIFNANNPNMLTQLPQLVRGCFSNNLSIQYQSCTMIRKILSNPGNPPIQQVINSGVVPRLIQFVRSSNDSLQLEAAWALTNIASGNAEQTANVVRNSAVDIFIQLIQSNTVIMEVKQQLIWALGNIAGDSKECRDLVIQHNVLNGFIPMCKTCTNVSFVRNMSWVLINFCRPKPIPKWEATMIVIECFNNLIKNTNDYELYSNYLWALYYLTKDINDDLNYSNLLINHMIQNGIVKKSIDLLDHTDKSIYKTAVRVIGNIVASKNDKHTETVLKYNVLSKLQNKLLSNVKDSVKEDILWTLSNITAGTNEQLEYVIKSNVFPTIINILNENEKYKYRIVKEALWSVVNGIYSSNETQMKYLVNVGAISAIFSCLKRLYESKKHNELILVVLECIESVLSMDINNVNYIEKCNGINILKLIQSSNINENENISNKINELLNVMVVNESNNNGQISDRVILSDDMILKSSLVCAWRYDNELNKWRKRGRGHLMVYKNNTYKYIKIIFKDIKYDNKIRLLQQIDINECDENNGFIMNDEMYVEWNGNDYSIDINKPLNSRWKLQFNDEPEKAKQFIDIFNNQ